jgi:acetyl-CoA acetyltransferase family protein
MKRAAIVSGVRTPVGKAGRAYAGVHPADLLATVLREAVARAGVQPTDAGQVLVGCTHQAGEQSFNIARNGWLAAGLPVSVPASTVDTLCGSSQQAANLGYALVAAGLAEVVVAAGVESLTSVPLFSTWVGRDPYPARQHELFDMPHQGIAAERVARKYGVTRADVDRWGFESQHRAAAAWREGRFGAEIVHVRDVDRVVLDQDEGIRPDTSLARLAELPPAFEADGITTAGNSSQLSDGAAAMVIASEDACTRLGLTPLAWMVDAATVGVDPDLMLEGPIVATEQLLRRNGLTVDEIAHFELHEAFAVPVCAWLGVHQSDPARVNPDGGAIAIGHPFGASGVRQLAHLAHCLHGKPGSYGLQAMCAGGGIGTGTLLRSAG